MTNTIPFMFMLRPRMRAEMHENESVTDIAQCTCTHIKFISLIQNRKTKKVVFQFASCFTNENNYQKDNNSNKTNKNSEYSH